MWKKLRSFPGLFHLGFGLTLCTRSTTSCGWLCIYLLRYSSKYVQWHSVINFSCRNNFPCMPEERHFGSKRFLHTIHRHTVNVDDRRIPASTWYTAIHNSGEDSGVDEHAIVCMRDCIPIRRQSLFQDCKTACGRGPCFAAGGICLLRYNTTVDASSLRNHMAGGLVVSLECYYCWSVSSNPAVARF